MLAGASVVELAAGHVLFAAGDPGDSAYVVLAGHLSVHDAGGQELRRLSRGDAVGELALLTGAARSATVRAARDSRLLRVDGDVLRAVLATEPAVLLGLAEHLARQLTAGAGAGPRRRGLGVSATLLLDGADPALPGQVAGSLAGTVLLDGSAASGAWAADVERAERSGTGVLLACAVGGDPGWRDFCLRTADRLVVLGVARSTPPPGLPPCDLVALELAPGVPWPAWAGALHPRRRARLDGTAEAVHRLARRLGGRSPGAVLSGGGARGMAHLGVMAGLEAEGLAVDRWGGCSMGAFVAALAAAGLGPGRADAVCRQHLVQSDPFRDLTLPRHALVGMRRLRRVLLAVFGDLRVEDLPYDYYCVTADLDRGELVVHREGPLAELVAASMAIPGLAPPVRSGGRLLVDGGLLDNLPVDVMLAAQEGPVLAVDVMRRSPLSDGTGLPSLWDTVGQAMTIGGRQRVAEARASADLVLTPELGDLGLLAFDRFGTAVGAGRTAVRQAGAGLDRVFAADPP